MSTYISLLRVISTSDQKKIKIAALRDHLKNWGFQNIKTYIHLGNLVFDIEGLNIEQISDRIKKVYGRNTIFI